MRFDHDAGYPHEAADVGLGFIPMKQQTPAFLGARVYPHETADVREVLHNFRDQIPRPSTITDDGL